MFLKATSALVGPGEGVKLVHTDRRNDHEVELAIVIGKTAKNVKAAQALDYIAGYCIGLDMTIRGPEERSLRKSPDCYCVLGPWLVTRDEMPDPAQLALEITVNGAGAAGRAHQRSDPLGGAARSNGAAPSTRSIPAT